MYIIYFWKQSVQFFGPSLVAVDAATGNPQASLVFVCIYVNNLVFRDSGSVGTKLSQSAEHCARVPIELWSVDSPLLDQHWSLVERSISPSTQHEDPHHYPDVASDRFTEAVMRRKPVSIKRGIIDGGIVIYRVLANCSYLQTSVLSLQPVEKVHWFVILSIGCILCITCL